MSISDAPLPHRSLANIGKVYTLSEAGDYLEYLDSNYGFDASSKIRWVDSETGQGVIIGYTPKRMTLKFDKKQDKKKKDKKPFGADFLKNKR